MLASKLRINTSSAFSACSRRYLPTRTRYPGRASLQLVKATMADEVLAINQQLLNAIAAGDYATYKVHLISNSSCLSRNTAKGSKIGQYQGLTVTVVIGHAFRT